MKVWIALAALSVAVLLYFGVIATDGNTSRALYILAAALLTLLLGPAVISKSNDLAAQESM
ncbi:MAG: hypothetical protein OIF55_10510 [Amphritea sp.]|nr:hypothetical protein [Amphritea sp.]